MKANGFTSIQAYRAMFEFLQSYYERTGADEIGALLGSMQLLNDGVPADSALWDDWLLAVEKISSEI